MKNKFLFLVVVVFVLLFMGFYNFNIDDDEITVVTGNEWAYDNFLIAHAMGGINGRTYTNSMEAFEFNYSNGHRVFEVDLNFTSDGVLVGRHEWADWTYSYSEQLLDNGVRNFLPQTLEQVKKQDDFYTTLTFNNICELLTNYKDVFIVTDTKGYSQNEVQYTFEYLVNVAKQYDESILDRVIVQVYNQNMYWQVKDIYDFKSVVYTLYASPDSNEDVLDFVLKSGIKVITIPKARCEKKFVGDLNKIGCLVYTHTIDNLSDVKKFMDMGVYGFYTNYLRYDAFNFEDYYAEFSLRKDIDLSTSIGEYFENFFKSKYDLILTVNNENFNENIEILKNVYEIYGFNTYLLLSATENYVAIFRDGYLLYEKSDIEQDTVHDVFFEYSSIDDDKHINIIIDSVFYKQNNDGLNVIVYDGNNNYIVDNSIFVLEELNGLRRVDEDRTNLRYMYLYKALDDMNNENYIINMSIDKNLFATFGNDILNKINNLDIDYNLVDDLGDYDIDIKVYDKKLEKNITEILL